MVSASGTQGSHQLDSVSSDRDGLEAGSPWTCDSEPEILTTEEGVDFVRTTKRDFRWRSFRSRG